MKNKLLLVLILIGFSYQSCVELESEVYSSITPDNFYKNDLQLAAAASAAYTALYQYWGLHELSDLPSDQSTVPIRTNGGWNDGGLWPKLMRHEFNPRDLVNARWSNLYTGVGSCNRLIEIFEARLGSDVPIIYELRTLRAFYYYQLLNLFGNVPIETRFAEADPAPAQRTAAEVFEFIESELLASVDNLKEEKDITTYAKVNKWVGYTLLAKLYINAERFDVRPHYQEAADAANVVINSGVYGLETGYFANFRVNNENSNENIFVVPYDQNNAGGFTAWVQSLNQSARPTYDLSAQPWGGFSIQEDFYRAFEEDDKRRGMFIVGQQYTLAGQPTWSDDAGFFYANPKEEFKLIDCTEDFNRLTAAEVAESLAEGEVEDCNVFITIETSLSEDRGVAKYEEGPKYGKYEIEIGTRSTNMSNDFPIYRYADVLLMRAEGLWRADNSSLEALNLINQIRDRAGLDPLTELTEDDLYWEIKKELAIENHAREVTIRFGHWEDEWFLKEANPNETFKRFYPIPADQLQANLNLSQNPGY